MCRDSIVIASLSLSFFLSFFLYALVSPSSPFRHMLGERSLLAKCVFY